MKPQVSQAQPLFRQSDPVRSFVRSNQEELYGPTPLARPAGQGGPMRKVGALVLLIIFLGLLFGGGSVLAQGIVPPPQPIFPIPPMPQQPVQISISQHHVEVVVDGPVARVTVRQIFRNPSGAVVEGVFLFPLPKDAAPSDFQMNVDGQVLEGQILDADEARSIYDAIVRRNLDPALLEYVGQGLFRTNVFPIPAGAERSLTFTYSQVVPQVDGLYRFTYPLRTRQYSSEPVESLSVSLTLVNQPGLRTLYSPSHPVSIQRTGDTGAQIGFEAARTQPEQDFELFFGTDDSAIGLNLLSYAPAGEDGFFLLLAAPGIEVEADEIVQRDLVLVLDTSGSMQGEKIVQAQAAARYVVSHLNPGDRFNLIHFSTGVSLWQGTLQPATPERVEDALGWIDRLDAAGSTDINRALLEALAQLAPGTSGEMADRPGYIIFLTDGLPTQGVILPEQIRRTVLQNVPQDRPLRLFNFGVGYDVNTDLLDSLSGDLGGRSTYVTPDERIDEKVSGFYAGISTPVLSGVEMAVLDESGAPVALNDSYPFPLPDLFAGEQLVLAGRYDPGAAGAVTVVLSGAVNGRAVQHRYRAQRLVDAGGEFFVARLWATRKIGALLAQIRLDGPKSELVDELVALSLTYGIVTPYTSYLVMEPDLAMEGLPPLAPQANLAPQGLGGGAADAVGMAVAESAAAPAVGQEAVAASQMRTELRYAQQVSGVSDGRAVRYVAGRTFVAQGTVARSPVAQNDTLPGDPGVTFWVDSLYDEEMTTETVVFGSPRYADLAGDATLRPWLALSSEMVLVVEGAALRITGADAVVDLPILAPASSSPKESGAVTPSATPRETGEPQRRPTITPTPAPTPQPDALASPPSRWEQFWEWVQGLVD